MPRGPRKPPPGLRAQFSATRDAAMALVTAHVDLAKAEASAIGRQVGLLAALGFLAFILVVFAAFLLVIGVALGIGEWVFGSMGWGVIHGVEAFLSIAMAAILVAVGISGVRIVRSLAFAIIVGILVGLIFGLDLPNRLYAAIGETLALQIEPGVRPLAVAVGIWGLIGAVVGLAVAYRLRQVGGSIALLVTLVASIALGAALAGRVLPDVGSVLVVAVWLVLGAVAGVLGARMMTTNTTGERVGAVLVAIIIGAIIGAILALLIPAWIGVAAGAIVGGVILGVAVASALHGRDGALATLGTLIVAILFGAFTAITFGPRVGAALGVTVGYIAWMAFMGADVARTGIDMEALKNRFYPVQSVETGKETLEWLQKRMPPGFGS